MTAGQLVSPVFKVPGEADTGRGQLVQYDPVAEPLDRSLKPLIRRAIGQPTACFGTPEVVILTLRLDALAGLPLRTFGASIELWQAANPSTP